MSKSEKKMRKIRDEEISLSMDPFTDMVSATSSDSDSIQTENIINDIRDKISSKKDIKDIKYNNSDFTKFLNYINYEGKTDIDDEYVKMYLRLKKNIRRIDKMFMEKNTSN